MRAARQRPAAEVVDVVTRYMLVLVLAVGLLVADFAPALAASNPPIKGRLDGFEWCTQGFCGSADFAGTFVGKVGRRSAFGVWDIAVNFDQLPPPGESVGITGTWSLSTSRGSFSGTLAGQLHNNGDNTFDVDAVLTLTSGGTGSLDVSAVLNHNTFPPTIRGSLSQ